MAKKDGELSAKEAAYALGANYRTVTRWARAALDGEQSKVSSVRRDATGHLYFDEQEIRRLAESFPDSEL